MSKQLTIGVFTATPEFHRIPAHVAVLEQGTHIVYALCVLDETSANYSLARQIASLPMLIDASKRVLDHCNSWSILDARTEVGADILKNLQLTLQTMEGGVV
jgi:hypothetical protein